MKQKSEWKYFDDCPICDAQKRADKEGRVLGERELRAAFDAANKRKVKKK